MSSWKDVLAIIGGLSGLVALGWRIRDLMVSHFEFHIWVERDDSGVVTAVTALTNQLSLGNKIDYAMLLVGPETEQPQAALRRALLSAQSWMEGALPEQTPIGLLRDAAYRPTGALYAHDCALIPLPFYYIEQVYVGDEKLKYRAWIDSSRLDSGRYSVRFYVIPPSKAFRCVQDLLVCMPPADSTNAKPAGASPVA